MNDEFKGKSGKVKVMYVREEEGGKKPNPRTGKGGRSAARPEDNRRSAPRTARNNSDENDRPRSRDDAGRPRSRDDAGRPRSRDDADRPRSRDDAGRPRSRDDAGRPRSRDDAGRPRSRDDAGRGHRDDRNDRDFGDSPWRTVSRPPVAATAGTADEAAEGKPVIDAEQIRRQRQEETRVYGENACQALFLSRPESIVRAWFVQSVTPRFRETLRWLAANRKAYHVVEDAELAKASGTEHHGGVCFIIKKRMGMAVSEWLKQSGHKDCVLALEDVSNPHNLGAIMRSCAHFGVKGLLVNDASLLESGAAVRTAEGGAEHVQAINGEDFANSLEAFRKAGYTIVTTSSHQGTPLARAGLPAKMVLVLGQEREGISDTTFQQGDLSLSIGGTGNVESLNVSVATGVLLAEWWRQNA